MNGYTKDPALYERIANLIEQIPMEHRLEIVCDCMPLNGNPHDLERNLTGYCLRKAWSNPVDRDDADILAAARKVSPAAVLVDPRTPQIVDGVSSTAWWDTIKEIPL